MGSDHANFIAEIFVANRVCNGLVVPVVATLQIDAITTIFYIFYTLELAPAFACGLFGRIEL